MLDWLIAFCIFFDNVKRLSLASTNYKKKKKKKKKKNPVLGAFEFTITT
jgi:hypothetical protein